MTIQSTTFGRVELSGKEAERFQRHMTEDKPNLAAKASLARGQAMLVRMAATRQARVNGKRQGCDDHRERAIKPAIASVICDGHP